MALKDWLKNSKKEIDSAVKEDLDKMNDRQKSLIPVYLQYKMLQKTQALVIVTWVLAILTVLVNLIIAFMK